MALELSELEQRVRARIDGCDVSVETDGYYYTANVISDQFEGLRPVKRQQIVYAAFTDLIADGSLHAININAKAPSEA